MKAEILYKKIGKRRKKINYLTKYYKFRARRKNYTLDCNTKPEQNFTFLMIFNRASFEMVKACLYSFLFSVSNKPQKVVLVSDGTWTASDGKEYFNDFKGINFIFEKWEESVEYHEKKGRNDLVTYANKQIWGKKLACILKYAEKGVTLFSDPDVLWYNTPPELTDPKREEPFLICQQGENLSYDLNLIDRMDADFLKEPPLVNAGIVLISGDFFKKSKYLKKAIKLESENPGDFSEQTILAFLVREFGSVFPYEVTKSNVKDLLGNLLRKNKYPKEFCARHYVWLMKVLYWKDFVHHF